MLINSYGDSCDKIFYSGNIAVGHVTIKQHADKFEIWNLEIFWEFRGKGFGNELMYDIIAFCEGKTSKIWLLVDRKNVVAQNLYSSWGFKFATDAPKYWAVPMELSL